VSDAAARLLTSHVWPGNVRELRNAIERAMILEDSARITPPSLPIAISRPDPGAPVVVREHGGAGQWAFARRQ